MSSRIRRLSLFAIAMVVVLTGCGTKGPVFVDEGTDYTADSAIRLLETSDAGDLAKQEAADSEELRTEALSELRSVDGRPHQAAELMTEAFSGVSRGVPYYVEMARFGGQESLLILEATGREPGPLSTRTLWVISLQGDVLLFSSR